MKLYYEDILVGEITTNQSMTVEHFIQMINLNVDQFIMENNFDDIDYNNFIIK